MAHHPVERFPLVRVVHGVTTSPWGLSSQVAELEPLQTQALARGADGEAADTLADAHALVADVLDVDARRDAVAVVGAPHLDGLDGQCATGRSDRDRRSLAARALPALPADRRHVRLQADHLVLQLDDLDRLDAQTLALGARLRRPSDVLDVRRHPEVRPGAGVVGLGWPCDHAQAQCGERRSGKCHVADTPCDAVLRLHDVH